MVLIADNLLFLENHSKGSIFHPLRVQDVIAIIGKLMIAIFVLYIHHKITEAEARVSGFSGQRIFLVGKLSFKRIA